MKEKINKEKKKKERESEKEKPEIMMDTRITSSGPEAHSRRPGEDARPGISSTAR